MSLTTAELIAAGLTTQIRYARSSYAKLDMVDEIARAVDLEQRGYASTVAALIPVDDDVVLIDWNEVPDTLHREYVGNGVRGTERQAKFAALGHAEQNVIASAAARGIKTAGATLILNWFPCVTCAWALRRAQIAKLICRLPDYNYKHSTYDFPAAHVVMEQGGIELELLEDPI